MRMFSLSFPDPMHSDVWVDGVITRLRDNRVVVTETTLASSSSIVPAIAPAHPATVPSPAAVPQVVPTAAHVPAFLSNVSPQGTSRGKPRTDGFMSAIDPGMNTRW